MRRYTFMTVFSFLAVACSQQSPSSTKSFWDKKIEISAFKVSVTDIDNKPIPHFPIDASLWSAKPGVFVYRHLDIEFTKAAEVYKKSLSTDENGMATFEATTVARNRIKFVGEAHLFLDFDFYVINHATGTGAYVQSFCDALKLAHDEAVECPGVFAGIFSIEFRPRAAGPFLS